MVNPSYQVGGDAASTPLARRTTPMFVLRDIQPSVRRYELLGLTLVETGDDGCVGMIAGDTGIILATVAFMSGDLGVVQSEALEGRMIDYLRVDSAEESAANLSDAAVRPRDVVTRIGTRELLIDESGELFILADTTPRSGPTAA